MSRNDKKQGGAKADGGASKPVGYKQAPVEYQFTPGKSGNPKGSSKRRRDALAAGRYLSNPAQAAMLAEADRVVTVTENGRKVQMTMRQLTARRVMLDASKGGVTAMRLALQFLGVAEAAKRKEVEEQAEFMIHTKMDGEAALKRAKAAGEKPPLLLPHPADIDVDPYTLNIVIRGPMDEKTYAQWKGVADCRDESLIKVAKLKAKKRRTPAENERLAEMSELIAQMDANLPPSMQTGLHEEVPDAIR